MGGGEGGGSAGQRARAQPGSARARGQVGGVDVRSGEAGSDPAWPEVRLTSWVPTEGLSLVWRTLYVALGARAPRSFLGWGGGIYHTLLWNPFWG